MISPKDMIAKHGIDGLCKTADDYYKLATDADSLKGKPFTNARDTPGILIRLGYLLAGLQIIRGLDVLDFGAGSCWISKILTQMGCKSIALDPSETALNIGKEMFEEAPVFGEMFAPPQFIKFDGRRIPLEDKSVDRIICFDTFHHVPNPHDILREFDRILKDGGILGMSEPVGEHSVTPDSQHEMEAYAVLENDINLPELIEFAKTIGFSKVYFKTHPSPELKISYGERNGMWKKEPTRFSKRFRRVTREVHYVLRNEAIFFLQKGDLAMDSRYHEGLKAELEPIDPVDVVTATEGEIVELSFVARNLGKGPWLTRHGYPLGLFKLGAHLFDSSKNLVDFDYYRVEIDKQVEAGEEYIFRTRIPAPPAGEYLLEFDLVAEEVSWMQRKGMKTVTQRLVVSEKTS